MNQLNKGPPTPKASYKDEILPQLMYSHPIHIPTKLEFFLTDLFCCFAGGIVCDDLPTDVCAFSISSSGKRCLLETDCENHGSVECKTSEVVVTNMADYIETDECVRACGVDRNSVGISSDALLEPQFTSKLCSPDCYQKCPNIIDLYFNLAAGEGMRSILMVVSICDCLGCLAGEKARETTKIKIYIFFLDNTIKIL